MRKPILLWIVSKNECLRGLVSTSFWPAITTLLTIVIIWLTKRHFSVSRAASLMERFSRPDFVDMRRRVDEFFATIRGLNHEEQQKRCLELCRDPDQVALFNELHAVGMFFAEIGVSFKGGIINCESLAIFDRLLPHYWHQYVPFIRACHVHFELCSLDERPLVGQKLQFFDNFRLAYEKLSDKGIAIEPLGRPARKNEPKWRAWGLLADLRALFAQRRIWNMNSLAATLKILMSDMQRRFSAVSSTAGARKTKIGKSSKPTDHS